VFALCWYSYGCKTFTFSGAGAAGAATAASASPSPSPLTCARAPFDELGPVETMSIPYPDFPGS